MAGRGARIRLCLHPVCTASQGARKLQSARGFTLIELIVTLIILGILAVFALPRFVGRQVFDTRGAFDEVAASLRFARQQAVAQRRQVCVALAVGGVTVTRAQRPFPEACNATPLLNPATGADYVLAMPEGVTLAARGATAALPTTVRFDALGQPTAAAGIRVNGDGSFCLDVVAGTGYVQTVACP